MLTKTEIKANTDPEFYGYILTNAKTSLVIEVVGTKLVLYAEYESDLAYIQQDILKILRLIEKVNEVYKQVSYPWEVLEILEKESA